MQHLLLALPLFTLSFADEEVLLERGREHCALFYDAELETLWERFAPDMRAVFGDNISGLEIFHTRAWNQLGEESEVVDERVQEVPGAQVYIRTARFQRMEGTFDLLWQFSGENTVEGFSITPTASEAPSRFLEYETKTALRLPFVDPWDVFWGGRTLRENYHTAYPDQRFAYDFLIIEEGKTHRGEGTRNEDFFCWGKRLVSPGDGVVISMANDVADNVPGEMNPKQALGNHVILDHGNGEFSFLAHFQQGSVQVEVGQRVESGDWLGLAGNSGNTSEPHLHYHLQNTPTFNRGEGLPSQFLDYTADGASVERGEPHKGQRIRPGKLE